MQGPPPLCLGPLRASTANTWAPGCPDGKSSRRGGGMGRLLSWPHIRRGLVGTWSLDAVCICVAARSTSTCLLFSKESNARAGGAGGRCCLQDVPLGAHWRQTVGLDTGVTVPPGSHIGACESVRGAGVWTEQADRVADALPSERLLSPHLLPLLLPLAQHQLGLGISVNLRTQASH